jgi:hypothetical protein
MLGIKLAGGRQHPNESQNPGTDEQESSKHGEPPLVSKNLLAARLLGSSRAAAHVQLANCPIIIF